MDILKITVRIYAIKKINKLMYINFLYVKSLVFKIESASSINYLIFDNFLPI
jgi:hypothetical protein